MDAGKAKSATHLLTAIFSASFALTMAWLCLDIFGGDAPITNQVRSSDQARLQRAVDDFALGIKITSVQAVSGQGALIGTAESDQSTRDVFSQARVKGHGVLYEDDGAVRVTRGDGRMLIVREEGGQLAVASLSGATLRNSDFQNHWHGVQARL